MEIELKATQELIDLNVEYIAMLGCRDKCIRLVFRTKSAIKYAKLAEKARSKFWRLSVELYPELADGQWCFNAMGGFYEKIKKD